MINIKTDNYNDIVFKFPKNYYNNIASKQKNAVAWDTETLGGKAFLLCNSESNYKTCMVDNLNISDNLQF